MGEFTVEDALRRRERTLYFYGDQGEDVRVYCSGLMENGAAMVLFVQGGREALALIPGVWWEEYDGFSEPERQAMAAYLKEHQRSLCHFALDRFLDHTVSTDLELEEETLQLIRQGCAKLGISPQHYVTRLSRGFIKSYQEDASAWEPFHIS